ncbi:MAG TPA: glutathione-disulfide reductase [bacterium]|nr:glutathione-disulfide reductase [bacterium]
MAKFDYDLFVIGAGSGGVRAARMSAQYGARVAIVEERYLGGTCVNVGCVPKKLLVYGAHVREELEDAAGYGWSVPPASFDWPTLIRNKNAEIARLNTVYEGLLSKAGVRLLDGRGVLLDPHTVEVNGQRHTAERILVATGGWPFKPDIPGAEHAITSNEAFFLERLPQRVVIGGGGYIAVEFAGILNGLGSHVTQLYRGALFLRGFDDDARAFVAAEMHKKGIDLRFNTNFKRIDKLAGDVLRVTLSDGSTMDTDLVLCAMGRVPNTEGLGLAEAGVKLNDKGAIVVDDHYQTNVPSIYALGDVIDRVQLTPVAIAEAMVLAGQLYGGGAEPLDYSGIPSAVFCQPPLGTVGLTEAEAAQRYRHIQVYVSEFRPMKHTLSGRDERTLMKLIVDEESDRVVGCHMVGPEAGEIIQGLAVALKCGATKAQFDATVGIHPTAAEEWVTMRTPRPAPAKAAAGD